MPEKDRKIAAPSSVLRAYAKAALKYPFWVICMLVAILVMQAADLMAPLYMRQFFNVLAGGQSDAAAVGELISVLLLVALWWIIRWVSNRAEHFINVRLIATTMADLVEQAFGYLIDHSYNFFVSNFAGSLTHKVNKYAKSFQTMFEGIVLSFFPTFLFAIGAVVVLYTRSPLLGVILLAWIVLFVSFQIWVSSVRQPLRKLRSEADTRVTATLADAVSNQSTITLFAGTRFEKSLFGSVADGWKEATLRSWYADLYIWSAVGLFMMFIELALLYGAILLWQRGLLTVGDFVLIQTYLITLFERLVAIQHELRRLYDAFADGGEMVAILQQPHDIQDNADAKALSVDTGTVAFNDADFYFNPSRPVLQKFGLVIAGGEKVALVGPSGAGKTTITKLLLRLYDVRGGSITIDGQDIRKVTQESLRNAIAFVPQEPILFHRTLMENIRYGRRSATDEEVYDAAKKAHCHEFISGFKDGYGTLVGERGVKLSGGERQRVAIARAILKDAPILILDEATSSLDSGSESLIQDALRELMKGKTVIVIAHRLSTIMRMDRIIVIEDGRIISEGTHRELLEHKGLYHKLWSIQAGSFRDDVSSTS